MKSILAAVLTLSMIAACNTDTSGPMASDGSLTGAGVSAPNTPVAANVTISLPSTTVIRHSGPANSGNPERECRAGGSLWNTKKNPAEQVGTAPHEQCLTIVAGLELTVDFSEIATWVRAKSGNENLNFGVDPTTLSGRGIQYKKTGNFTEGFGTLYSVSPTGWTIDLSKVYAAGDNLLQYTSVLVEACNTADSSQCGSGFLTW